MSDLHPETPDPVALQRRVLLTGLVTLVLFVALGALAEQAGGVPVLVGGVVLIWLGVVRPLMRPVREAVALRRRLAYQAFLEARDADGPDGPAGSG